MSIKLNLKTLKDGDIVHFRCGGTAMVGDIYPSKYELNGGSGIGIDQVFDTVKIVFHNNFRQLEYRVDGMHLDSANFLIEQGLFDIVRIEKVKSKKKS